MNLRNHRKRPITALAVATTVVLAGCASSPTTAPAGSGLSGTVVISGSSTVEPITSIVAEDFAAANPDVQYSVDGPGTGDGFALFCAGDTDISDASRPISDEEIAACDEAGIEYVELQIAIDGISVITSPDNADVTCLSFGDLYALLGPESQGFESWSDADELAGEIGNDFGEIHAPYQDAPLDVTAPGEESGTFDSFVELVLDDIADARGQDATTRPDYQASADDNVIIENIGGSASSLGWVGSAFADQSRDSVKSLEIDAGEGCVAPTAETIASNEYPISRPLFIYVNTAEADARPELAAFVDYYLSDDGIGAVTEADYVALDEGALEDTRVAWEGR
ncbi:MAG TPA: phosphate ABC transporter substrate-binding protein PstS family protein [Candidatus Limnocylindria bacterium]|nr:phosphate ABC transporter substrate-binding protein PstS family protein [Candidatus Limnocylindria bacterium]